MISIGNITASGLWVGSIKADFAFLGDVKVWEATTPPAPTSPLTKVKYTAASGLPDWEGDIVGPLSGQTSSPWYTNQIPNVQYAVEVEVGTHVTTSLKGFYNCTNLESVSIPGTVDEVLAYAFQDCSSLSNVSIGDGVKYIRSNAFMNCSAISSIIIPGSMKGFNLTGCSGLTNANILDGVTEINSNAFFQCVSMTSVTIPNTVTTIKDQAFRQCMALPSITIPSSVTLLDGYSVFDQCNNLKTVTMTAKDISTVQGMRNYPWGLSSGCVIHCTDGDITL